MAQFSIVIPCYNAECTIRNTLKSIVAQTLTDWELICVDDGSTDDTCMMIRAAAFCDPRIRLVHNESKGPSSARNFGAFKYASAPVIAFCDADDIWGPNKLAELANAFSDHTIAAAYGKVAFFKCNPCDARVFSTPPKYDLTIEMLLGENPVCTLSNIAVRKSTFAVLQGFNEDFVHNEDLDWLIRLVGHGARVVGLDRLQVWYRASGTGLSADLPAMAASRKRVIQTAARYGVFPKPAAHAIYYRYLARRALRLGQGRTLALRFALWGVRQSPRGFFKDRYRGSMTLSAAIARVFMPASLCQTLFSR